MNVYVFGNIDTPQDNKAIQTAHKLASSMKDIDFIYVNPNEDLPFSEEKVVILDTVEGIDEPKLLDLNKSDKIILPPRYSVHDFDLGFQLRYLKKLGKLKKIQVIGIPIRKGFSYLKVQSILRKLVAQDIQGS